MHPETVEIVEFTINDRYQDILAGILEREADLIGFSTYIWNTDIVQDLAADIRRVRKDRVVLFAGGPEASYAPERFLGSCDFVICWEGERPFAAVTALALEVSGEALLARVKNEVPGAAYLADKDLHQRLYKALGEYFILPSSVHELLILPNRQASSYDVGALRGMVREVNMTQVAENEVLSNNVYVNRGEGVKPVFGEQIQRDRRAPRHRGR